MRYSYWIKIKNKLLLGCFILFFSNTIDATPLSADNMIKVGMTAALTGPSQTLGKSMKEGIEIYFNKINAMGGIFGKKLKLIVLDDKYEPELAGRNMRHLIDQDHVIVVIGNVGTPTATITIPIANEKKTLLFGALTGADILRKTKPDRYIINLRASYQEEISMMITNLLATGIKPDEIAFFTQNDAYGDSGYDSAMSVLKKAGYTHPEGLPHGRYKRNTTNVEAGLADILNNVEKTPKAFIIVGTYKPSAKFINLAKIEFPDALFLNLSFVGAVALNSELKNSHNVIVTQVVPYFNMELPAIREYHDDIKKYLPGAKPGFISLEGYLVAKLFVKALEKAATDNKLTHEGIIDTFEKMHNVDIGIGELISFDQNNHQALHVAWPTTIINGETQPMDWSTFNVNKTLGH